MKKTLIAACLIGAGVVVAGAASPARAACGHQDLYRSPGTYVTLDWRTGWSFTKVEPHGGTRKMRAVIGRYKGGIRYYYGRGVRNGTWQHRQSYVSSRRGSWAGNWYKYGGSSLQSFHNDYGFCRI